MPQPIFAGIEAIPFKGPDSQDPLSFRFYDKNRVVRGKRMEEQLRVAVCYWHTFCGDGKDPFGSATLDRPWQADGDAMAMAKMKAEAAFEFFTKLGNPYYCFHDRDVAPEGKTLAESNDLLDRMVDVLAGLQQKTGMKLLWGTANLFSNPRFMSGASTNPDPEVFAYAAAQVKKALEVTQKLGGENYVLWGGREGYETLLNTDMKKELDQMGRFMNLVCEHKHKIGFKGPLLIEPKPREPSKHQYDFDSANVVAFLQKYGLSSDDFRLNIENNHATLAGHTFEHEVAYAFANDRFGSIDMNRGDLLLGWDTDQFPNDAGEMALVIRHIIQGGGFKTGGFNFDAHVRRQSIDLADLFHAHIGGMDVLARAYLIADKMIEDGKLQGAIDARYKGWGGGIGKEIMDKKLDLAAISDRVLKGNINPKPRSGQQEMLENLVNRYV
jgi:xylose isomerase